MLVTSPGFVPEASEGNVSNLELFEKMFAIQATDEGPVSRAEKEPSTSITKFHNKNSPTSVSREAQIGQQRPAPGDGAVTKQRCAASLVNKEE